MNMFPLHASGLFKTFTNDLTLITLGFLLIARVIFVFSQYSLLGCSDEGTFFKPM